MKTGIYKITCEANGMFYIGSSKHIRRRWEHHKTALKRRSHHNHILQSSYNKHGSDTIRYEIIEDLKSTEQRYIDQHYDNQTTCMNIANTVDRPNLNRKLSPEHRAKIAKSRQGKKATPETIEKMKSRWTPAKRRKAMEKAKRTKKRNQRRKAIELYNARKTNK
jgi:group I intron endonuclease